MVTINEVIERVNKTYPDAIDDEIKAKWLIDLEGRLYCEVYQTHNGADAEYVLPKSYPEDGDKELLAKAPYDNLYDLYIVAQTDLVNREDDSYNNSAVVFNNALDEFKKEYHRTHMPKSSGNFKNYW